MYKHSIFLYNSYFYKKKMALHYCGSNYDDEKYIGIIYNIKNKFSHLDFNIHVVYTDSTDSKSIHEIDSYFDDIKFIEYYNYSEFIKLVEKDISIDAVDVSKAILCKKSLSNLELQQVLYIVADKFRKKYGIKLFKEEFEKFTFGLGVQSVYDKYSKYEKEKIIIDNKFKVIVFSKLSKFERYYELLEIIDDVLKNYNNCSSKNIFNIDGNIKKLSKKQIVR